jgi:hypothetical protein
MLTIKIVGRVRPSEPEMPEGVNGADWFPRRWAGAMTEWHAGFESVLEVGQFSIIPEEDDDESGSLNPWVAARKAFDWYPEHGFGQVHVGDFTPDDRVGTAFIGHKAGRSEVWVLPSDTNVYLLGENGQTVDRL